MRKYILGNETEAIIRLYALILTFLFLGIFLRFNDICIISETIKSIIECVCLCISGFLLMYKGIKLRERGVLGIKEMAFGSIQLYIMIFCLPITNNNANIFWFISIAYYLFNFIYGLMAFFYSLIELWSSNASNSLSKIESIVVIITSIFVAVFAGIQLFI